MVLCGRLQSVQRETAVQEDCVQLTAKVCAALVETGRVFWLTPERALYGLSQSVQRQIAVQEEIADARQVKGVAKILVQLMKRHPDITPFHLHQLLHQRDIDRLRNDPALDEPLAAILEETRARPDLNEGARLLLKVGYLSRKLVPSCTILRWPTGPRCAVHLHCQGLNSLACRTTTLCSVQAILACAPSMFKESSTQTD